MKILITLGIIVLFAGTYVIPSTVGIIKNSDIEFNLRSGGYIQGLIDNASAGDTIYISAGIYYENIIINKSISLIGEDKNTTIIDGGNSGDVVFIEWMAHSVKISGFTIQNSGSSYYYKNAGIDIRSYSNIITGNTITSNGGSGIYLRYSHNTITRNTISNNNYGIYLRGDVYYDFCINNTITDNNISNNSYYGITLGSTHRNTIISNSLFNNGLSVYGSFLNNMDNNLINGKPLVYLENKSDEIVTDAGQVILVRCNNINVNNLNLSNASAGLILVDTHNCIISDNIILNNLDVGITLDDSKFNNLKGNTISNNGESIRLVRSSGCNITNNIILNNLDNGIKLYDSKFNNLKGNTISNNGIGINIQASKFNNINGNTISNNGKGISLYCVPDIGWIANAFNFNIILKNNFIDNEQDAYFSNSFFNIWILNYWNRPRILPKVIIGEIQGEGWGSPPDPITLFNIDWRPALRPYDIGVWI
jgi:parallel beta-helix repeat protein